MVLGVVGRRMVQVGMMVVRVRMRMRVGRTIAVVCGVPIVTMAVRVPVEVGRAAGGVGVVLRNQYVEFAFGLFGGRQRGGGRAGALRAGHGTDIVIEIRVDGHGGRGGCRTQAQTHYVGRGRRRRHPVTPSTIGVLLTMCMCLCRRLRLRLHLHLRLSVRMCDAGITILSG